MSIQTDTVAEPAAAAPAALAPVRPFYWSVRRELWENRAIYLAPAIAAAVLLFGFLIGAVNIHGPMHIDRPIDPMARAAIYAVPFGIAAAAILVTSFVVAFFYCLGALHAERRDRTILFWKSLPVSDLTAVLSKAVLPLVILPVVTFAVIVATHLVMLALSAIVLPLRGLDFAAVWNSVPLLHMWALLAWALVALALWYAPIWGWLMLVGGWARRVTFLWGVGPPIALCVVERIGFGTTYLFDLLRYRLSGGIKEAFTHQPHARHAFILPQPDPLGFALSPGLWLGLAVAGAFIAAAIWLRRYREPI